MSKEGYISNRDMDIIIDFSFRQILIKQRWKYVWKVERGLPPWTDMEKREYHNQVNEAIWHAWSGQAYATLKGNHHLAEQYRSVQFPIHTQITEVTNYTQHWNVEVTKKEYPGDSKILRWYTGQKKIILDSHDTGINPRPSQVQYILQMIPHSFDQVPVTHEFGHTIGASDEYLGSKTLETGAYIYDEHSIMNIGTQIRERHFDLIRRYLNRWQYGLEFDIRLF